MQVKGDSKPMIMVLPPEAEVDREEDVYKVIKETQLTKETKPFTKVIKEVQSYSKVIKEVKLYTKAIKEVPSLLLSSLLGCPQQPFKLRLSSRGFLMH